MSENERDTHFIGFARTLLNEILDDREGSLILGSDLYPQDNERVAQHIARRAYDLACHVASGISESMAAQRETDFLTAQECVEMIDDMDKLPE